METSSLMQQSYIVPGKGNITLITYSKLA